MSRVGAPPRTRTAARAVAVLAGLVAAALLAAGCGSSTPAKLPPASQFGVNATGTVHFWTRSCTQQLAQPLVDQFNKTHPRLHVVLTPITCGTGAEVTEFATSIRAGIPPDLYGIDDIDVPLFQHAGELLNLKPYVDRLSYHDALNPGQTKLGRIDGGLYSVPYLADLTVLWYNKTLFRRAGLNPDRPPRTFDELLRDARAITKLGHGIKGFAFAGNGAGASAFSLMGMMFAGGTNLVSGPLSDQHATVLHNEPLRRLLTLLRSLWTEKLVPVENETETGATYGNDFVAGQIGMESAGWGAISAALSPAMAKQVADAPLPGPDGGYSTFVGGDNFVIPKGAKNPSGAWEFVKWALSKEAQLQLPKLGFTPVRTDLNTPSFRRQYPTDAVALKALGRGNAGFSLAWDNLDNTPGAPWLEMLRQGVFGSGVPGALRTGQAGIESVLADAGS